MERMNRAFEKILEFIDEQIKIEESIAKSENEGHPITHQYGANCMNVIKKFVQEVAEEFATDTNVGTNGWIPCSERLPEELKELREKNETLKALYEDARKEGNNLLKRERNKAIDDFADKIISLCDDGEFMNRFNKFTATTILETAEQLKAGEIYD